MTRPPVITWAALAAMPLAAQEPGPAPRALTRYVIEARWAPAAGRVAAVADIELSPELQTHPSVTLDLVSAGRDAAGVPRLAVMEVLGADGRPLAVERLPGGAGLRVAPVPASLRVRYRVAFDPADVNTLGYYVYAGTGPGNFWYPEVTAPDGTRQRFHDFRVTLVYPATWRVMTSGVAVRRTEAAGTVTERFAAPHVEGFMLALGEGFVLQTLERDGLAVTAFADTAHTAAFRTVAERTLEAAAWYRRTYGFFPVSRIGIVQGFAGAAGGFPMPNVFMVHLADLRPAFVTWLVAHELGHYYWGLYVLDDGEPLGWLTLANGIWADQLYMAERGGHALDVQWTDRTGSGDWYADFLTAMLANREQRLGLDRADEAELGFDYNTAIRHAKGAVGLFLQARRLGTERFLALQRQLLQTYRYRPMSEDAFVHALEEAGIAGAAAFFTAWKRGDARLEWCVEEVSDGFAVVRRRGNVPYPIEVAVVTGTGDTTRHTVSWEAARDTVLVDGRGVVQVLLDPGGVTPMWNSANPAIRARFLEGMDRAGLVEPFLTLAADYLEARPADDRVRRRVVARLRSLGRQAEAARWAEGAREDR